MRPIPTGVAAVLLLVVALRASPENRIVLNIEPTPANPRNSEGAFATLKSGRIIFCYSQFYGGRKDYSPARIVEIDSDDGGRRWTRPRTLIENGANVNVMSVSLLRLADDRLAMFYIVKKTPLGWRPFWTTSADEGRSWSESRPVFETPGCFSLNNDRVIQTRAGRIIVPVAFHRLLHPTEDDPSSFDHREIVIWYCSDDEGASWHEATPWWALPVAGNGLQEPGVVELSDNTLFSWARTDVGTQYGFRSRDGGETWSAPEPTELRSPCSPACIKRLPDSDALLAVYNDHSGRFPYARSSNRARGRSPLVAAISTDGGRTWPMRKVLEDKLNGDYCYTAIHFVDHAVLLAYLAFGPGEYPSEELWGLRIRRVDLSWLPDHP